MDLKGRNSYSIIRMYVLYKNIYIYNLLHWIDYISNFHCSKLCYRIFGTFSIKTFNF